jgi:hypothetical protein
MTYRATYRNGAVILQPGVKLAEGAELIVSTVEDATVPTLGEVFGDVAGQVKGKPSDGSAQHDHYIYGTAKR